MFINKHKDRRIVLLIGIVLGVIFASYLFISSKQVEADVLLYSESQMLMDKIAEMIGKNTIDYESYSDISCTENISCALSDLGMTDRLFLSNGYEKIKVIFDLESAAILDEDLKSITPARLKVVDFNVYISPLKKSTQKQAQATIVLKTTLSDSPFVGKSTEVLIQRTISTGVISDVQYYAK